MAESKVNVIASTVLSVLPSLAGKLTENFLERKNKKIAITELQDQIAELVAANREMALEARDTRNAVLLLAQQLVATQANVFALRDGQLELASALRRSERHDSIDSAIREFNSLVTSRARRELEQAASARQGHRPQAPEPQDSASTMDVYHEFFDGFQEEVFRARQGLA